MTRTFHLILRYTHPDITVIQALRDFSTHFKELDVRDITYSTTQHVLGHARREALILELLAFKGAQRTRRITSHVSKTLGKTSHRTINRDVASLQARGLITATLHTSGTGNYHIIDITRQNTPTKTP